jgi:hypothetical protein
MYIFLLSSQKYKEFDLLRVFGYSESKKIAMMEDEMKRVPRISSETRDLSDKELNQMTSAMGDSVRLQSLTVSSIIQANLKAEFTARRNNASKLNKAIKSVAA